MPPPSGIPHASHALPHTTIRALIKQVSNIYISNIFVVLTLILEKKKSALKCTQGET
jgi:hypothetical protein